MSNYKVGDIIKLTRESLNLSQEELSFDICSVQTLSRIENGKVSVKRDTYEKLMERMGRNGAKSFAVLSLSNFDYLDVMYEANTALAKQEYEKLAKCVKQLKPYLLDNVVNEQYIRRLELILANKSGEISDQDYINELEKLLSLTVPYHKKLLEDENSKFPFLEAEIRLLLSISNKYMNLHKYDVNIQILEMLLRSLDIGYIDQMNTYSWKVLLLNNLAKAYGEIDEHQKAVEIVMKAIQIEKQLKKANTLSNSYGELAWNMMEQIKKGDRAKNDIELCKKYMRQGYAVAALYKKNVIKNVIASCYKEYFDEDIYFSSSTGKGESFGKSPGSPLSASEPLISRSSPES